MLGYQPWRCMKHNLIADVVIKPRWFLKIAWENFVFTQFACEDVGLWPFYNSYVKKKANCFTTKCSQAILRNATSRLIA